MSYKLKVFHQFLLMTVSICAIFATVRVNQVAQINAEQNSSSKNTVTKIQDISRTPNRSIASTEDSVSIRKKLPALEKLHSLIQVRTNENYNAPETGDQETLLEAWIKINDLPTDGKIQFQWQLDPGVHAIDGDLSGEIFDFQKGETKYFSIRVYGFSKEVKKVAVFTASGVIDDTRIGQSGLYNSRPEDSFEYIAPLVQQKADELNMKKGLPRGRIQR